jgi:hypothetical protein
MTGEDRGTSACSPIKPRWWCDEPWPIFPVLCPSDAEPLASRVAVEVAGGGGMPGVEPGGAPRALRPTPITTQSICLRRACTHAVRSETCVSTPLRHEWSECNDCGVVSMEICVVSSLFSIEARPDLNSPLSSVERALTNS